MKKKILNHTSIMIVLAVLITFLAASVVTYSKFNTYMQNGVREEARYICLGMEECGDTFLSKRLRAVSSSRVTLIQKDGTVLFDSQTSPEKLENHSNRPEFMEAEKDGKSESIRYSETFAKKTFYYAVRLDNGNVLRVGKTVDSVYSTWISSLAVLGILMVLVLILEFAFVERQTRELIKPINDLDLEHPLNNVCYEELRPLLVRVDEQNRQIRQQVKELKEAEKIRKEFSANVSHELKTPLMSISGYAELMMNGMVPADHVQEFIMRRYVFPIWWQISYSCPDWMKATVKFLLRKWTFMSLRKMYRTISVIQRKRKIYPWSLQEVPRRSRVSVMCCMRCFLTLRIMRCAIQNRMVMCVSWSETVREIRFTVW